MGYIIQRTDQGGGYVAADSGTTGVTYTHDLAKAIVYRTREAAEANRCKGNEIVVPLESILRFDR